MFFHLFGAIDSTDISMHVLAMYIGWSHGYDGKMAAGIELHVIIFICNRFLFLHVSFISVFCIFKCLTLL